MSGTLAKWGSAFSDFQYAEDKTKNPPFYKMMSDNSSNAIEIFAHKKKMEAMRKEIKDHIMEFQHQAKLNELRDKFEKCWEVDE